MWNEGKNFLESTGQVKGEKLVGAQEKLHVCLQEHLLPASQEAKAGESKSRVCKTGGWGCDSVVEYWLGTGLAPGLIHGCLLCLSCTVRELPTMACAMIQEVGDILIITEA